MIKLLLSSAETSAEYITGDLFEGGFFDVFDYLFTQITYFMEALKRFFDILPSYISVFIGVAFVLLIVFILVRVVLQLL